MAAASPRFHRTPEDRFADLPGYAFAPHYLETVGLRMHYLDEGPGTAGVMLLLHGEPTWSFLYRNLIPVFTAAGYRIVAPDMIGFGKSDKVIEADWYTLDAHVAMLRTLIEHLDLRDVTLVCQDWGGPIGLINATDMPERFNRLVVLNTWLHHEGYAYTDALRAWNAYAPSVDFSKMGTGPFGGSPDSPETLMAGYRAPFEGPETQTGAFRWPWMLPFMNPKEGGAARQSLAFDRLAGWAKPANVIFGDADAVFDVAWGRAFAAHIPGATFDTVTGGHMVQEIGRPLAELILDRIGSEVPGPKSR